MVAASIRSIAQKQVKKSAKPNCGVAYFRTSSLANVGHGEDSQVRQVLACKNVAANMGLKVAKVFSDHGVSSTDPIKQRKRFQEMLEYMAQDSIFHILAEDNVRLARDLIVQELAFSKLTEAGVHLVSSESPQQFLTDNITSRLIRPSIQIYIVSGQY